MEMTKLTDDVSREETLKEARRVFERKMKCDPTVTNFTKFLLLSASGCVLSIKNGRSGIHKKRKFLAPFHFKLHMFLLYFAKLKTFNEKLLSYLALVSLGRIGRMTRLNSCSAPSSLPKERKEQYLLSLNRAPILNNSLRGPVAPRASGSPAGSINWPRQGGVKQKGTKLRQNRHLANGHVIEEARHEFPGFLQLA